MRKLNSSSVLNTGVLILAAGLFQVLPATAQVIPPVIKTVITEDTIRIDGLLDEPSWHGAGVISELIQQDPHPGQPTSFQTEVRILVDQHSLYVAFICHDPDPTGIAMHTMQRDGNLYGDDTVAIVLDTTGDGRRGYLFRVNSAGARLDGLIAGSESFSADWDGIWDAKTRRSPDGWTAEIRIPAQTLRFTWGLDRWGFNVERFIARERTTLRWSSPTLDSRLVDLQRAGVVSGVGDLRQGLGLSISPFGLIRSESNLEVDETSVEGDVGGDITWNVTRDLTSYLTINTDFAETEVDTRQINLTRFPLFFPEKRAFFLEGSDLFEFGLGAGHEFIPFFSRRVGLFEGEQIPILAGVKVLGRAGPWSVGLLDTAMDETKGTDTSNLFVGRVTYDFNEHLTIGTIVTDGDPEGVRDNTLIGLDAVWRTSTFMGDKNFSVGGWAASSQGDVADGARTGWGFKVDYPNDLWDVFLIVKEFGDALDPALGFLPRPGTRWYQGGGAYQPRPASDGAFGWARQFYFELFNTYVTDLDGNVESWRVFTAPLNVQLESGEHIEANVVPQFEYLAEPFEVADGVVIPQGSYHFTRYRVEAQSSRHRSWRVGAEYWFGDFFTGDLQQLQTFVTWTIPSGRLQTEVSGENNFGHLPEGDFSQRLWQLKLVWAFTPDLILSSYSQYDSESREVGVNNRFRWTIRPGRDLFVVWNHGWKRPVGTRGDWSLHPVDDSLVVKIRWTWRW